ncbi:MAG: hypothetical protein KBE39_07015, partial [Parabacteroides sp.]|nr:hypothetical protein [Parabacteroides sp.]MBP9579275.1 hypothetical protein [Parabacteroides sp.]
SNQDYTCIFDKPFIKSEKSLQNTRNERLTIISCTKSDEEAVLWFFVTLGASKQFQMLIQ